jgi:hypothetical protein
MQIKFKIPQGLAKQIVCERELRTKYQTNRLVRVYGFYLALKSVTTANKIQGYNQQIAELCQYTKTSRATFYNYLNKAERANLLIRKNGDLYLTSWDKLFNEHGLTQKSFISYEYDLSNKLQTPEYLIAAAEIQENQNAQIYAICKKIDNNPLLKFRLSISEDANLQTIHRLQNEQKNSFVFGIPSGSEIDYNLLHTLNVDFQRSWRKLRIDFGYKSKLSVTYLKRQLQIRGIAQVGHRILTSAVKSRKWKLDPFGKKTEQLTNYDIQKHQTIWRQPDLILLNLKTC